MVIAPKSKWLTDVEPDEPVSVVARRALQSRFDVVEHFLPLAALHYEDDTEYVHQLRVGCRRAVAAMDVFSGILPAVAVKQTRKVFKKIRRAANDARDNDVLLERLLHPASTSPLRNMEELAEIIKTARVASQASLLKAYEKYHAKKLLEQTELPLKQLSWNSNTPEPTYAQYAKARLSEITKRFFNQASGDLNSADALHELRIEGKHLRYAFELLASAFPNEFKATCYPPVEALQEKLGRLNDFATAQATFQRQIARLPAGAAGANLAEAIVQEWNAFEQGQAEFLTWWTAERVDALHKRFVMFLE